MSQVDKMQSTTHMIARKRRVRGILSDFYKDAEGGDGSDAGAGDAPVMSARERARREAAGEVVAAAGVGAAPTTGGVGSGNIDSPNFETAMYVRRILATQSLKKLLRTDEQLTSSVKQLDSGMKTLVYENYNKFISATDTIRQMKDNVIGMEEEMQHLAENMKEISAVSAKINNTLAPRRRKIEELSGVSRLLKKRQFLFELPSRLKQCVELKAYAQAVRYYNGAHGILTKYSHLPSFRGIVLQCDEIIDRLKKFLRRELGDETSSASDVAEFASILLDLNDPPEEVRASFLSYHTSIVMGDLERFTHTKIRQPNSDDNASVQSNKTHKGSGGGEDEEGEALDQMVARMNMDLLLHFLEACNSYETLFLERLRGSASNSLTLALGELDTFIRHVFSKLVSVVRQKLAECEDSKSVIAALEVLERNLTNVSAQISNPAIIDAATKITNSTLDHRIQTSFAALEETVIERLEALNFKATNAAAGAGKVDVSSSSSISSATDSNTSAYRAQRAACAQFAVLLAQMDKRAACQQVATAVVMDVKRWLTSMKPFMSARGVLSHHADAFVVKLTIRLQQLLLSANIHMLEYVEPTTSSNASAHSPDADFLLLLSRLCLDLQDFGVPSVMKLVLDFVDTDAKGVMRRRRVEASLNAPDLMGRFRQSARQLLVRYVALQGVKLSKMIRTGVDKDWLSVWIKEPRDVRPYIDLVLDELADLCTGVESIFPASATGSTSDDKDNNRRRRNIVGGGGGALNQSSSMFDRRTAMQTDIEFDPSSVLTGVVKLTLKSAVEYARLRTFGKFGYQQIQVEAFYLRAALKHYVHNPRLLSLLTDELVTSCANRCVDPIPMESGIVSRICEEKLRQLERKIRKEKERRKQQQQQQQQQQHQQQQKEHQPTSPSSPSAARRAARARSSSSSPASSPISSPVSSRRHR